VDESIDTTSDGTRIYPSSGPSTIDEFGGLFDPLLEIERTAFCQNDPADSMEILLSQRSVNQLWDARDRAVFRAPEHVLLTSPSAKEAGLWA
jgi:hypothetical protein